MPDPQSSISLRFPGGIDNRSDESELPEGCLRECENFDITREGSLIVRNGLSLVNSGAFHSIFSHKKINYLLVVKDGYLQTYDGTSFTSLKQVSSSVMSYAYLDGYVYFCNGSEQGMVSDQGTLGYWGLPVPPTPICSSASSGGLYDGVYQVTLTTVVNSVESGAPEPCVLDLSNNDNNGIRVTAPTSSIASFAVYVTEANDSIFRKAATLSSGASATIGLGSRGKILDTLYLSRPPAGSHVNEYRGRLWIAKDNVVWFTSEYGPHYVDPARGYYLVDKDITMLASVEDGLYIGTENSLYFLKGNSPSDMSLSRILNYGIISYSQAVDIPNDIFSDQGNLFFKSCAFVDTNGVLCIGRPGGMVQRVTDKKCQFGNAAQCSTAYIERNGLKQFVSVMIETISDSANTASDYAVASVVDNGIS